MAEDVRKVAAVIRLVHTRAILRHSGSAELLSGCAVTVLGLAALGYTVFAPRSQVGVRGAGNTYVFHNVSVLQLGQPPAYLGAFALLTLVVCGFTPIVTAHLRTRNHAWGVVLLGLTLLLLAWVLYPLSYPVAVQFRMYYVVHDNAVFLPVLAFAVVATVLALRAPAVHAPGPHREVERPPRSAQ